MDRRFFHRLGASRLDRTICSSAGEAGLTEALGLRYGTEPEQFRHSRLIIAWGANILGTNVHLWPFVMEARRQGAKLYTIDARRNRTGAAADKHFFINPGSDAALALAMMHVIIGENLHDADYVTRYTEGFEELRRRVLEWTPQRAAELTGLAAEEIAGLAREYATTRPAAIRLNYGIQRSERGAMAVRAVALLPALIGSWKEIGGGLQLSTSQAFHLNRGGLERADMQQKALGREARIVNMAELGSALRGAVKALVVYNSNPAAIAPDQNAVLEGLRRTDLFTVVLEQFQNDTADYADYLLPATTFLEHTDLYLAYGHYYLQLARPALPAPGEAKSNVEIFRLLAERMGFDDACFRDTEDDMIRTLLDSPHPFVRGITLEELERERFVRLRIPQPFLPFASGGFGMPGGKCHFHAETLDYTPPVESRHGDPELRRKYPFELISPKNDDSMNSTFGHRDAVDRQTAALHLAAADAARLGIHTADPVRVFNDRGCCVLRACVDDTVRPGVVCAPSVRWGKRAQGKRNVNALASERLTDAGGGPTFYSCMVQVEREWAS
jgi:anaerobic selenocysteine-containing dehydrogenase